MQLRCKRDAPSGDGQLVPADPGLVRTQVYLALLELYKDRAYLRGCPAEYEERPMAPVDETYLPC